MTTESRQALPVSPATAPPPGVEVNFDDPLDLRNAHYAVLSMAIILPTIALALRLYTKAFVIRKPGLEDWIALLGWALFMVYCGWGAVGFESGLGRYAGDVRLADMESVLHAVYIVGTLYGPTTVMLKWSILLQYLRIFSPPGRRDFMFWGCWGLTAFLFAFYGAGTLAEIFKCTPREKFWAPWRVEGHCFEWNPFIITTAAVNSFADLVIILLPQGAIWRLNTPLHKKLKTSAIFFIGLFALGASLARLYHTVRHSSFPGSTNDTALMALWTYAEFATTIICSCIPSLARFVQHLKTLLSSLSQKIAHIGSSSPTAYASQRTDGAPNAGGAVQDHGLDPRTRKESHTTISEWELSTKATLTSVSDEEVLKV